MANYYKFEPEYSGDIDAQALTEWLEDRRLSGQTVGWAFCAAPETRVSVGRQAIWHKPGWQIHQKRGHGRVWESVWFATNRKPARRVDLLLTAATVRGTYNLPRAHLIGRKPPKVTAWIAALVGGYHGDTWVDWFPGSGLMTAVARAIVDTPSMEQSATLPAVFGITDGAQALVTGDEYERAKTELRTWGT